MTKIDPLSELSYNVRTIRNEIDCMPILSRICRLIPQNVMTELATSLQEIYRINRVGGSGSRKRVTEILLRLGIQPND